MKRLIALFFILFFTSGCLGTGGSRTTRMAPMPEEELEVIVSEKVGAMRSRLDLSPDQVKKVRPIIHDQVRQRERIFLSGQGSGSRKSNMVQLERDTKAKLAGTLSKDQMAAYEEMKEEERKRMEDRPKYGDRKHRPAGPPD